MVASGEQQPMKKQTYRRLREEDRRVIYNMSKEGNSQQAIAEALGVSQSTVSRELRRNCGLRGYRPGQAQRFAQARLASKPARPRSIGLEEELEIVRLLRLRHSPEQIAGSTGICSHETIYRYVARDRAMGGELHKLLRINGRRRYRRRCKARRERIPGRVGIEERPASVGARATYGHWEADLIEGSRGSGYLVSLLERKSRTGLLGKVATKRSEEVAAKIKQMLAGLKALSITYDNGLEFAAHEEVNAALGCRSYFCSPYSSWEKGSVENQNGLVRQYVPKKASLEGFDEAAVTAIQEEINQRPRKTRGFRSAAHYRKHIAA